MCICTCIVCTCIVCTIQYLIIYVHVHYNICTLYASSNNICTCTLTCTCTVLCTCIIVCTCTCTDTQYMIHISVHVHDMCIMLQCMLIIGFFCYLVVSEERMIIVITSDII